MLNSVNLFFILRISLYFSGADLAALVREASVTALREFITSNQPHQQVCVSKRHFDVAFAKVKPSVSLKVMYLF